MTTKLLLDEMLSDDISVELRARGHDVVSVVADRGLVGLPDHEVLARATSEDRAVVTRNVKDFAVLDAQAKASDVHHAGLVLVSTKAFPHDRAAVGALVRSLDKLLSQGGIETGTVVFLQR